MDYTDRNIQIATNIPGMKDKILANIKGSAENIFWYIKFNIPLDETSVSEKTMSVTDTEGYLMRTEITYDVKRNLIIISPLDTYEQEVFYVLRITKKVRSQSGNYLKSLLYIVFKLRNNQISEFKTLKSNVKVPGIKKRPANYDTYFREKHKSNSKLYSFEEQPFLETLPSVPVKVNFLIGVFGLIVTIAFLAIRATPILIIGLVICIIGISHIIMQLSKKETRSAMAYNKGARMFNKEAYEAALAQFKKATFLDPNNERAEYALNKMAFYT